MNDRKALVLLSGGQDSTTCLAWALERFEHVETLAFDYGQRHAVELQQRLVIRDAMRALRPSWALRLGEDHLLELPVLGAISDTALTQDRAIELQANGLPNTFVPGRNLLFLTLAGALAYRRGLTVIVGGMCETDFSGYPDCRDSTIKSQQATLTLGLETPLTIETPLMWLDKAETWALAENLGGPDMVAMIVEHTHTCYVGDRRTRHSWGYGCGACPACSLRRNGWECYSEAEQSGLQR